MGRNKYLLLPLFFLLGLGLIIQTNSSPTIVSADLLDSFSYDAIFWEDWNLTSGAYEWQETNSTLMLEGIGESVITNRVLGDQSGESETQVSFLARANYVNSSTFIAWANSSFAYRKNHVVTGSVDGALTDYPLMFQIMYSSGVDAGNTIYLDGDCQTDFDDVRFYNGSTYLDYWIQDYTASVSATFWVEVDTIPASPATVTITVYYGNSTIGNDSDGERTFIFFDDFNDNSFNATKWDVEAGADYAEAGGKLEVWNSGVRTLIDGDVGFATLYNVQLHVYSKHADTSGGSDNFLKLHEHGVNTNDEAAKMWYATNQATARVCDNGGATTSGAFAVAVSTYQHFHLTWKANEVKFYEDYFLEATLATDVPDEAMVPAFWAGSNAEKNYYDWVFMGKWTTNAPTHTSTGDEQTPNKVLEVRERINYNATASTTQHYGIILNETHLIISYYNWSSTYSEVVYSFTSLGVSHNDYLFTELTLDAYTRSVTVDIDALNETSVLNRVVYVDAVPEKLREVEFNATARMGIYDSANVSLELVWVEAPFNEINGLRSWSGTGTNSTDNPYYLTRSGVPASKSFNVLCMPLQGIKFLYNLTRLDANPVVGSVYVRWFNRNGTFAGGVRFRLENTAAQTWIQIQLEQPADSFTAVSDTVVATNTPIGIAVWVEPTGRVYAYIQYTAKSSDFQDFSIYDITGYADLDSWGVQIRHAIFYHALYNGHCISQLNEVEIFYGIREGISQPRFGGMWWLYNPLLMAFLQIVGWIQAALAPFIVGLGNLLAPVIAATTGAVNGLITWLSDQLDALLDIWGVIATLVADIVVEFVNEFITPAIQGFANWMVISFVSTVFNIAILTQAVLDFVLRALSTWFWGDATILPNLVVTANLFIFETIRGLGYFLISGRIFAIGFYVYGMLNGINSPLGWETLSSITTIPDVAMMGLFWVVSYAPVLFTIYMLIAIMRILRNFIDGDFDFDAFRPLWDMFWMLWKVGDFIYSFIRTAINSVWSLITAVMEIIPF